MHGEKRGQHRVVAVPNAAVNRFAEGEPADLVIDQAVVDSDEAFNSLIRKTSPIIYRFLVRMAGSAEDAQDLTQEVFLAVHKSRAKLRVGSRALPYLFTIARRKAISFLRWRSVRAVVQPLGGSHQDLAENRSPSPRDQVDEQERWQALESAIGKLKPTERAAVILRLFEERPYDEVAQILGKPVGTVRSVVFRAERKLRKHVA